MNIADNTEKLINDVLDTIELFIEQDYKDIEKTFEDYTIRVYMTTERDESIVEWDYDLKNADSYLINEQEVIDRVYDCISY